VTIALLFVAGFGVTRLLLPEPLREHELLWILPVGACTLAVGLAALGYAHVPFGANLAVVLIATGALGVYAVRRRGLPRRPPRLTDLLWPAWIAVLCASMALVPVFRAGMLTVPGTGSDAHLAAGTAHFLKGHAPTAVAPEEPVDRVPLVWRSKPPIYYPLAAVSEVSGRETWEALAVVATIVITLAALGFFLLARQLLGVGAAGAAVGMGVVALDRVVLQTVTHPYFNQTWGFFTLPFALVLAWWAARTRSRGGYALLALFLAVGAFAYPLMLPIPLAALAVLLWPERRRLRGLWRGPRSLLWMVPLALVAAVPVRGVVEKANSALGVVLDPTASLRSWGGDLVAFIPEHQFVGMPSTSALVLIGIPLLGALVYELRRQPRELALALGAVLVFGVLVAVWFRPREYGWYFHFKALAFVGPLALLVATAGVSRLRRLRGAALTLLVLLVLQGARDEISMTFDQTPRNYTELRTVDRLLPAGASVRLDLDPPRQLWAAYFLSGQPLCSRTPLLNTSYPHVPVSRKADYVLREHEFGRAPDAVGPVVWSNIQFTLRRLRPDVPGPEACSREMVQTIKSISVTGRGS